jgi:adenylate kinase
VQELQIGGTHATDAAPAARFLPVLPDHHFGELASALTVISYSDVDHRLHRDFNTRRARENGPRYLEIRF